MRVGTRYKTYNFGILDLEMRYITQHNIFDYFQCHPIVVSIFDDYCIEAGYIQDNKTGFILDECNI